MAIGFASKTAAVRQLDAIAKALCKLRAGGCRMNDNPSQWIGPCEKCNKTCSLQWCHFIGRRSHAVRWDRDNALALCGGCHMKFDQKTSLESMERFMVKKLGEERVQAVRMRHANTRSRVDYMATYIALKQEWHAESGEAWR